MSRFLDTSNESVLTIGICARCSRKFPIMQLQDDPNFPGLKVCRDDMDEYDPYRLAPRPPDQIAPPFVRPDLPLEYLDMDDQTDMGGDEMEDG